TAPPPTAPPADPRPEHLAELERIQRAVATGRLSAREGHQRVSRIVRSYVGAVSALPADRMTLDDLRRLRRHGVPPREELLISAIELMHPPSFAPTEEGHATERFDDAARRAIGVVTSWT
ncbi:MAG: hypothetical protein QM638_13605, partial [Nocardioides sp.]|uniref:hypothetical protein n=1 Tax=Nocardioides sp. TaxID=35761 RepID=UPI0039E3BF0A